MNNFLVYYSGGCFERGDSPEQAEKKVYGKVSSLGNVLRVEATAVHPDESNLGEENYIVSFEGEIMVEAKTKVKEKRPTIELVSLLDKREKTI